MRTEDVDIAQFHGIAVGIGEAAEPLLARLKEVDASFAPVPSLKSPMLSSALRNARGYRVELLTPHQGADERGDDLMPLPSLPGLGAQPLRFLDYLLYGEIPTVRAAWAGDRGQRPGARALRGAQADRGDAARGRRPAQGGQGRGPGRRA